MEYYFRILLSDELGVVPNQVKVIPIRRLSLPPSEDREEAMFSLERLVDESLRAGRVDTSSLSSLRSDWHRHDLLAFLTERIGRLLEHVYAEVSDFLSWLETELQAERGALQAKSGVASYYLRPWEAFFQTLRAVRKSFRANLGERDLQHRLRSEFSGSVERITNLRVSVGLLEQTVDEVVYQLYQVSPEERGEVQKYLASTVIAETQSEVDVTNQSSDLEGERFDHGSGPDQNSPEDGWSARKERGEL